MFHYQAHLRGIESARESAGYYKSLDSDGITVKKYQESNNLCPTIVAMQTINYEGHVYTNPS